MKRLIGVVAAVLLGLTACSDPGADTAAGGPVAWADPTASLTASS